MVYTLSVWGIWMVVAAAIGAVVGWLLGRIGAAGRERDDSADADRGADVEASVAAHLAEIDWLRMRVGELERAVEQRDDLDREVDRLRGEVARLRAEQERAEQDRAARADVHVPPVDADGVAALLADRDRWAATAAATERLMSELRVRLWNAEAQLTELRAERREQSAPASPPRREPAPAASGVDLAAGSKVLGIDLRPDDLTVVEGIGPRIAELCRSRGIDTWAALAAADVGALRHMLHAAGPRFSVHDPTTWPEQARCLAAGDWEGFARVAGPRRDGSRGE